MNVVCMYNTVCPLRGPGHDISVGGNVVCMYNTVCPLRGPGHDISVGGECSMYV